MDKLEALQYVLIDKFSKYRSIVYVSAMILLFSVVKVGYMYNWTVKNDLRNSQILQLALQTGDFSVFKEVDSGIYGQLASAIKCQGVHNQFCIHENHSVFKDGE